MKDPHEVESLIEPTLVELGYELVRVRFFSDKHPRLQVMAERVDGRPMTVEDCAELSRTLSAVLDVEDPIAGSYTLEVSSPGIDRPLVRRRDYERFAGREARIETSRPIAGRRRFRGTLLGVAEDAVKISLDGVPAEVPLEAIRTAKLVLTDSLIEASLKQREV